MRTEAADYWKLFKPSACSVNLKGATQEDVFEEIVGNLIKAKLLAEDRATPAIKALLTREGVASTGVGQSVAVPHVKLDGIEETVLNISLHSEGIEWRSLDGLPVHILFTVLRPAQAGPKHDPKRHLELMRWISQVGQVADFRRFALSVTNRSELIDLLKEISSGLA